MTVEDDDRARWQAASHAMQSGVQATMDAGISQAAEPKHLRVGINIALSDHGGLVDLLIDKGIITSAEYFKAIANAMEREKLLYESRLSEHYGSPVTLV